MYSPFPELPCSQSQPRAGYGAGLLAYLFQPKVRIGLLSLWTSTGKKTREKAAFLSADSPF